MSLLNGEYLRENDYSVVYNRADIWTGELPFKRGSVFPTKEIRDRADISKTNLSLYYNGIEEVYKSILAILPETDPIRGYRLREIVARLPYYRNNVDNWVGLVCGKTPFIYADNKELQFVIDHSNLGDIIKQETVSNFLDCNSAYKVYVNNGRVKFQSIMSRNVLVFMNKDVPCEVEVIVIFNIYKNDKGGSECEFNHYFNDGRVVKRVFNYNNGKLGSEIMEKYEEGKGFEKFDISPVVVSRHNVLDEQQAYGVDMFRYWDSSICGTLRAFQNLFRVGEKCAEFLRKVPSNAISKDNVTGVSMFMNRGTIEYDENKEKFPEIEYIQPDFGAMDAAIKELDEASRQISSDTGLSQIFFNIDKLGSNMSAKAIEAMLYPTKIRAFSIRNNIERLIHKLVEMIGAAVGIDTTTVSVGIEWRNTMRFDEAEFIATLMDRIDSGTISKVDAISLAYDINKTAAKEKFDEILKQQKVVDGTKRKVEVPSEIKDTLTNEVGAGNVETENMGATGMTNEGDNINSNQNLWETQMPLAE